MKRKVIEVKREREEEKERTFRTCPSVQVQGRVKVDLTGQYVSYFTWVTVA